MMELIPVFLIIYVVIVFAIALAVYVFIKNSRNSKKSNNTTFPTCSDETKGLEGESIMSLMLNYLPTDKYKVFNDLMVLYNGHTVQIDHVVVSQYGIFVIETKDYSGKIYGGDNSQNWIEYLNGCDYHFYNPILQNHGHIKALSNMLSLDTFNFVSIIAFSRNAEFKYPIADNVMFMDQVKGTIQSYTQPLLSEQKVSQICQWLFYLNIESEEVRQKHVNDVTEVVAQKRMAVANGICPRCGGELVLRNGRYGDFYGCRNYPRCNYTKPLK